MIAFVITIFCVILVGGERNENASVVSLLNINGFYAATKILNDSVCSNDLNVLFDAFVDRQFWAMQMFDATVKFPDGLLHGNYYQMGNFDECLSAMNEFEGNTKFTGQYCLIDITAKNITGINERKKISRHSINTTIHWGICVPSTCQSSDVQTFLQFAFGSLFEQKITDIQVHESRCTYNGAQTYSILEIIYSFALVLTLIAITSASIYHCIHIYRKNNSSEYHLDRRRKEYPLWHEMIVAFSIIRNVTKIISAKTKRNDFNLDCVSGIKSITMLFIIIGHSSLMLITSPTSNRHFAEEEISKVQNAIFLSNPLLVDSFLIVSGFLMCKLLLVELDKRKGRLNILFLYIGRYARLTPAYVFVIGLYSTILLRLNAGPLWKHKISIERDRCLSSWWANLLYINNYVNTDHFCMFQSWYLAVDTQLYMLAPFLIYPLWRWRRFGEVLLGLTAAVTGSAPFLFTYFYNLDPTLMIYVPEVSDLSTNYYYVNFYIKTHFRANAYVVGLLFGYIVHRIQVTGYKIPSQVDLMAWTASCLCGLAAMFTVTIFYVPEYKYSIWDSAAFAGFHRLAWNFAIGTTLLICVTGKPGNVTRFLSWTFWAPFAKLTYCTYLLNGLIVLYAAAGIREAKYLSISNMVFEISGHVTLNAICAFVVCVIFESPIHNLEKLLLRREKVKAENGDVINFT